MPSLSLVIPAYNEEKTLESFFLACFERLQKYCHDFEVLILDDCSEDATLYIAKSLAVKYPDVTTVLRHKQNQGIARTFEDLYKEAKKEYVLLLPGDAEFLPSAIDRVVPLLGEFDLLLGERETEFHSGTRRFVSSCYTLCTWFFFGVRIKNPGAIKCMKKEIIDSIAVSSTGVFVDTERVIRASRKGYRIGSFPVEMQPRTSGQGRGARWPLIVQALSDLLRLRVVLWKERFF